MKKIINATIALLCVFILLMVVSNISWIYAQTVRFIGIGNTKHVTVDGTGGGDYLTISAAVSAVGACTDASPCTITLMPDEYEEAVTIADKGTLILSCLSYRSCILDQADETTNSTYGSLEGATYWSCPESGAEDCPWPATVSVVGSNVTLSGLHLTMTDPNVPHAAVGVRNSATNTGKLTLKDNIVDWVGTSSGVNGEPCGGDTCVAIIVQGSNQSVAEFYAYDNDMRITGGRTIGIGAEDHDSAGVTAEIRDNRIQCDLANNASTAAQCIGWIEECSTNQCDLQLEIYGNHFKLDNASDRVDFTDGHILEIEGYKTDGFAIISGNQFHIDGGVVASGTATRQLNFAFRTNPAEFLETHMDNNTFFFNGENVTATSGNGLMFLDFDIGVAGANQGPVSTTNSGFIFTAGVTSAPDLHYTVMDDGNSVYPWYADNFTVSGPYETDPYVESSSADGSSATRAFMGDYDSAGVVLLSPATGDTNYINMAMDNPALVKKVWCSTDTGTASIRLLKTDIDLPNTADPSTALTDPNGPWIVCDATGQSACDPGANDPFLAPSECDHTWNAGNSKFWAPVMQPDQDIKVGVMATSGPPNTLRIGVMYLKGGPHKRD